MQRVDIAIVGGGPAGSWAATRLARSGAKVVLLDGSHPREKPCGGGVTGRALALLGLDAGCAEIDAVAIERAAFEHTGVSATVDTPVAETGMVVVSRRTFDTALLAAAQTAGAALRSERVVNVERSSTGWIVTTRTGRIAADWLLGADGPNSLVRRRVHKPFDRADLSIAAGYYVHGATSRGITIAFVDDPPGYLWSFPRRTHLAVGVCAQADVTSSREMLAVAAEWIASRVAGDGVRLERYSWPIPSLSAAALAREPPSGPGWFLLGDAGGMVDPVTREGIFFALESANAAAASLGETGDSAARYRQRVRDTVHAELSRAARLKARFFTPHFTRLLIGALQHSGPVRTVMSDLIAGTQPYRGLRRRLLATCEIGLMIKLWRSNA